MIDYILKIATEIGIFAVAAFFIQKIIENAANKRLEEFKGTLSIIQNKQATLHSKRLEIIEQLYAKLIDLNSSMYTLTNPIKQSEEDFKDYEKRLTEKASSDYNLFNSFYQKNKIYFNESTCQIIEEILKGFNQAYWDYNEHKFYEGVEMDDREVTRKARMKVIDAYNSIKDEIPKVRNKLEKDFRKLLNVD